MNPKKLILLTLSYFLVQLFNVNGQEAIVTSGGNASGSGGAVSYSVGQTVYTSSIGSNGSVLTGVQQPFEISEVTGVEEAIGFTLKCSAYPNPTSDFLILNIDNYNMDNLSYSLYNSSGQLIERKNIIEKESTISLSELRSAIYFLKVSSLKKELKTFKIIKN